MNKIYLIVGKDCDVIATKDKTAMRRAVEFASTEGPTVGYSLDTDTMEIKTCCSNTDGEFVDHDVIKD